MVEFFYLVLIGWCVIGILTFACLLFIPAPYGRHSTSFGKNINGSLGWIAMEMPSVIIYPLVYLKGDYLTDPYQLAFLTLWEMHYLHRTFIYAWRRNKTLRPMPLSIVVLGMLFNCFNAFLNSYWINVITIDISFPLFLFGSALFLLGFLINFISDEKLLKLRQKGELDYQIPIGGLYHYVSCPNYLGEIVEWLGFFLATLSPAAFAFFLWTCANLIPRALSHHAWYKSYFPNYPKKRKAVFPLFL